MALIPCAECGKDVSDKAQACPGCGHPVAPPPTNGSRAEQRVRQGVGGDAWLVDGNVFETREAAESYALNNPESQPASPSANPEQKKKPGQMPFWLQIAVGLVGAFVMYSCVGAINQGDKTARAPRASGISLSKTTVTHLEALSMCQEALKRLSRDPENAHIPYVAGEQGHLTSTFRWSTATSLMRMRNGLGLEVGVSGHCVVDRVDRIFMELTLEGVKYR